MGEEVSHESLTVTGLSHAGLASCQDIKCVIVDNFKLNLFNNGHVVAVNSNSTCIKQITRDGMPNPFNK